MLCVILRCYTVPLTILVVTLLSNSCVYYLVLSTSYKKIVNYVLHTVDTGCVAMPKILVALLLCALVCVTMEFLTLLFGCDLVVE